MITIIVRFEIYKMPWQNTLFAKGKRQHILYREPNVTHFAS